MSEEIRYITERKNGFFVITISTPGLQDRSFILNRQGIKVAGVEPRYGQADIRILNDDFAYIYGYGHVALSNKYKKFYFNNDCFFVQKGKKWGLIAEDGKEIFAAGFDDIQYTDKGIAVKTGDKWGYVLYDGTVILDCIYDVPPTVSENVLMIKRDGKWGFADMNGKEVVPPKYKDVGYSHNGFAVVEAFESADGSKYAGGMVDVRTGEEVVPCQFYYVENLNDGYACVQDGSKSELMDEKWVFDKKTGQKIGGRSEYIYEENGFIICADLGRTGYYSVMSGKNCEYVAHVDRDGLKRFEKPKDKEV